MNDQSQLLSNSSNHGTTSSENIRPKGSSGKRASVNVLLKGSESIVSNAAGEGIIGVLSSSSPSPSSSSSSSPPSAAPCGACKFLRRKCINGCIFAPHFGSDQGAARFAAVHKVFGASNVSKILLHIPENRRNDAVVTISYEAQARLTDPVYGCVSTILALQQQVASLQAELAMVQTQLMNSRYAMANVLQDSQVIQQQQQQIAALQPAYSNTSSASNNLININSCNSNFEFAGEVAPPSSNSFDPPLHISQIPQEVEEDDEEESQNPLDFTNQIFHQDDKTFF